MKISAYKEFILKENEILFKEGEKLKYIFLVKTGEIISVKEKEGRYKPLGLFSSGDFVGTITSWSEGIVKESAIAKTKSILIPLPLSDIGKVMKVCPQWVSDVLETVSSRIENNFDLINEHNMNIDFDKFNFDDELEANFRKVLNV